MSLSKKTARLNVTSWESEEKWKSLIMNAPNFITIVNKKHIIEFINHPVTGLKNDDVIGRSVYDYVQPEYHDICRESIESVFANGKPYDYYSEANGPNGTISYYQSYLGPVIVNNEIVAVSIFGTDITVQKRTEDCLRTSESFKHLLTESSPDFIFLLNSNTTILYANRVHPGHRKEDVVGKKALSFISPDYHDTYKEAFECALDTGQLQSVETVVNLPDGNHNLLIRLNPLIYYDGTNCIMQIASDITERKRMEEQLRQSEKMRAIGQLAGGIAHDFNNQLSGIVGYADLLREELSNNPELSHYADNILFASKRASDLTSQLLAFARKGKYLSVTVNIHKIIYEIVEVLQRTIDKRIRIKQHLDAQIPLTRGDPTQLQNAIMNIALNSRDAMPNGGELLFSTSIVSLDDKYCNKNPSEIKSGNFIRLCISDDGIGMDATTKIQIFEPFFTTKAQGKGTGMGLASVYGTIKNHNGAINVYSEKGHGTTMNLYFPLHQIERSNELQSKIEIHPISGSARILLVDDEDLVLDTAKRMLEKTGYSVSACRNGREAIEFYKNNWQNIDLVILDMVMPEINGKETFLKFKKINPQVLTLLSSGFSINGEAQKILEDGVKGFIQKPYRRTELSQKVDEILKEHQINME